MPTPLRPRVDLWAYPTFEEEFADILSGDDIETDSEISESESERESDIDFIDDNPYEEDSSSDSDDPDWTPDDDKVEDE